MSINSYLKKLGATAAFVGALAGSYSAYAEDFGQTATVSVLQAISVTEGTKLNFGVVQKPSTGSQTAIVGLSDDASGTINFADNTVASGDYTITGDATNLITIDATDLADVTGLTLTEFTANYNTAAYTLGDPGAAAPDTGKALIVGATLNVASTVANGTLTPGFNLTVTYD